MEAVDIYGHIRDNSTVLIGVGNYNNIHGLACYYPSDDILQIRSMPDIMTPSVIEVIVRYERPTASMSSSKSAKTSKGGKVYFFLEVKNNYAGETSRYINVDIDVEDGKKVATAMVSTEKAYFTIDYSSVDKTPRDKLLAGALYSLQTTFGEQDYVVSWKINGFSNGDLIIFLPTTWYENVGGSCETRMGAGALVDSLNQLKFKGYTTQQWCESGSHVVNCHDNNMCGECFGPCQNPDDICWPNGDRFICGPHRDEPNMIEADMVSFAQVSSTPQTTGTFAAWAAVIAIFLIVAVLAWGLSHKHYSIL